MAKENSIENLKARLQEVRISRSKLEDELKKNEENERILLKALGNAKLYRNVATPRAEDVARFMIHYGLNEAEEKFWITPIQIERFLIIAFAEYWRSNKEFLFCDEIIPSGAYWQVEHWRINLNLFAPCSRISFVPSQYDASKLEEDMKEITTKVLSEHKDLSPYDLQKKVNTLMRNHKGRVSPEDVAKLFG